MTTSGDINSATAGNNAGSVNTQAQTPASRLARQAQNNANAATNPALRHRSQLQPATRLNATPMHGTAPATTTDYRRPGPVQYSPITAPS